MMLFIIHLVEPLAEVTKIGRFKMSLIVKNGVVCFDFVKPKSKDYKYCNSRQKLLVTVANLIVFGLSKKHGPDLGYMELSGKARQTIRLRSVPQGPMNGTLPIIDSSK